MTEEDPKKKFWRRRNPFFDLFSEFDRMDDLMDDMMERAFEDMESMKGKPMTYGFSMRIGPDGKPQIQEFGNVKPTEKKLEVKDAREPLVDVINHETHIDVLAEMPGVEKKDIDLNATKRKLTIEVPARFYKEVALPEEVDEKSIEAHYKNGVLTVKMKKMKPKKAGTKVKIE